MPFTTPIINNFSSGEVSPILDARTDLKKYYSGCRTLKNFICTLYGGVVRRPGTYYVAETKHSAASEDKKSRLIPFEYNVEQAYILEFGNQYIRFYKNGGQIVYTEIDFKADPTSSFLPGFIMTGATSGATAVIVAKVSTQVYTIKYVQGTFITETINCGGRSVAASSPTTTASSSIVEVSSTYLEADLFDLHIVQSADVLYIVDSNGGYQPRKLSRYSHDYWILEAIDFNWGPFLDNNTEEITLTYTAGGTESLGALSATAHWKMNDSAASTTVVDAETGNDGTSQQNTEDITTTGIVDKALTFNGTTDYIEAADSSDFAFATTFSVSAWIKPKSVTIPHYCGIVYHADWATTNDGFYLRHLADGRITFGCLVAGTEVQIVSNKTCSAGTWQFIVGTRDASGNMKLYINGVLQDSTGINAGAIDSSDPLYIGKDRSNNLFSGAIDNVAIFDECLTQANVDTLCNKKMTASSALFTSDDVGTIWKLAHPRTDNVQYDTCDAVGEIGTAIHLKNTCRFRTTVVGEAGDQYVIKRKYDNDPDYHYFKKLQGAINYDLSWEEPNKEGADYIVELLAETADTDVAFILSCEQNYNVGYVNAVEFVSSTIMKVTDVKIIGATTATKLWAEGAWSDKRGWPRTLGFFEGRVVYAANTYNPLTTWFSETNDFEGMSAKTLAENDNFDDDALIFTISAAQQNMIKWIMGQETLLIGTAGAEGKLTSYNRTQPLTPDNIPEYRPQSSYGSSNIQPIIINDVIVFVQRENRKIREFKYDFDSDIFVARDLTIYAKHITEGGITQIALQKQPDSILWAVRNDGTLPGMTYERLEDIYGWFRFVTDGNVESSAVISSAGQATTEDEVWMIVNRTIGGSTKRFIEYMKPRDWGSTDTDVFFVDSGLSVAGSGGNTYVGGLDHLEGETVDILIDGKVGDQQVVGTGKKVGGVGTTGYVDLKIGGVATASTIKLHIGLNYVSDLQPMKLEIPMGELGTARGRKKRIHEAVISFKDTLGGFYGRDADNLDELDHAVTGTSGVMTALKTEEQTISFPGEDETSGNILIRQSYPLPMTVRCIIPKLQISEM